MTLDLGKPVRTKGGSNVRILCTDAKGDKPIVGLVAGCDHECAELWYQNGHWLNPNIEHSVMDLINITDQPEPPVTRADLVHAMELLASHFYTYGMTTASLAAQKTAGNIRSMKP